MQFVPDVRWPVVEEVCYLASRILTRQIPRPKSERPRFHVHRVNHFRHHLRHDPHLVSHKIASYGVAYLGNSCRHRALNLFRISRLQIQPAVCPSVETSTRYSGSVRSETMCLLFARSIPRSIPRSAPYSAPYSIYRALVFRHRSIDKQSIHFRT